MAQANTVTPPPKQEHKLGTTARRDNWWVGPLLTFLGLSAFLIYGTWAAWQGAYYEIRKDRNNFHEKGNKPIAPYLSPLFSPLIYDPNGESPHAWIKGDIRPTWLPSW